MLKELPGPPPDKNGWPWTLESEKLPITMPGGLLWPKITIVTPSFNQGKFIEETIRSVLLQNYPNFEYILIDGGSTDESIDIIKTYSPWIKYWVSEPDKGQSDAINKGIRKGSGTFCTWINSDDMFCKNALYSLLSQFTLRENNVYLGDCQFIKDDGTIKRQHRSKIKTFDDLVNIRNVWRNSGQIVQPEVIFPRQLFLSVNGLNIHNNFSMDYELWGNFFFAGAKYIYTQIPMAMFRKHKDQKTKDHYRATESLINTASKLVSICDDFNEIEKKRIIYELNSYRRDNWNRSGMLARLGLPPSIVLPLRKFKSKIISHTIRVFRA